MNRSFLIALLLGAALAAGSCAAEKPMAPATPPPRLEGTPTLVITTGIRVLSQVPLPAGFAPIAGRAPMWLQNGTEIGVAGTLHGHTIIMGFSGPDWQNARVLAAETGRDAAEEGTIIDAAPSPDGMTLATAVIPSGSQRLDIALRDLIATGPGHPIASFDGAYDSESMSWLNNSTIALALRAHPEPPAPPAEPQPGEPPPEPPPQPSNGLQLIVVSGPGSAVPLKLDHCPMSALSWSTGGVYAIGQGDAATSAVAIDRRHSTCRRFIAEGPIHVLDWSRVDEGSFIYVQPMPTAKSAGVFKYDLAAGSGSLVAAGSTAAAYTADGKIIALGNRRLNWRSISDHPNKLVVAQMAIFDPDQPKVDVKSLGFTTPPSLLVRSAMTYSAGSDRAAIETYAPAVPIPMRKIIIYAVARDAAFQVAYGPARGVAELAWSPKGRWLAILDGDAASSALTVILPPS
jgi:hypothetical protein